MFYFFMLDRAVGSLAGRDLRIRQQLDRQEAESGLPSLYRELLAADPKRARQVHEHDAYRIKRAVEICRLSQKPASAWAQKPDQASRIDRRFCLRYADRKALHASIAQRLDAMFKAGFVDEVCALMMRGDLHLGLPAARAVGYRQIWEYLKGNYGRKEMRRRALAATCQLVKRQQTWLKRMDKPHDYAVDELPIDLISEKIAAAIQSMIK